MKTPTAIRALRSANRRARERIWKAKWMQGDYSENDRELKEIQEACPHKHKRGVCHVLCFDCGRAL